MSDTKMCDRLASNLEWTLDDIEAEKRALYRANVYSDPAVIIRINTLLNRLKDKLAEIETAMLFLCAEEDDRDTRIIQDLSDGGDEIIIEGPRDGVTAAAPADSDAADDDGTNTADDVDTAEDPAASEDTDTAEDTGAAESADTGESADAADDIGSTDDTGTSEDTVVTDAGDPFILDDLHPGDETNGWEIVLEWQGTTTAHIYDPDYEYEDAHHSYRFTVGDNGTLYEAWIIDKSAGGGCHTHGTISMQGDLFSVDMSGRIEGSPYHRQGQISGRLIRQPDAEGNYPVEFLSANWTEWNEQNDEGRNTGATAKVRPDGRSHMYRITLAKNYYDPETGVSGQYCGNIP